MPRLASIAAVRGAISSPANQAGAIRSATSQLLRAMLEQNHLAPADIVSAVFTATPDLDADFPAHAARLLGWHDVPLLGATEMGVRGAPKRIIRVLLTVRVARADTRLSPVYLNGAAALRPDLSAARATRMRRVAIIGLGQVGGSLGLALGRAGGWRRVGFDLDAATAADALAGGAIDVRAASLAEACANAELALLAVPVDALPAVIAAAAAALPRGATLLDTGSARAPLTAVLKRAAARGLRVCGGHPLAGNEGRGFAAARGELFRGERFALLPIGRGVPPLVTRLVRDVGATPLVVTPRAHDVALARTSHLPYVLACTLASLGADARRRGLSGPGFAGMTRLAASDPRMAGAYTRANAREVRAAWRALRAALDARVTALARARSRPPRPPRGSSAARRRTRPASGGAPRP